MRNKDYWKDLEQAAGVAYGNCVKTLGFIGLAAIPDRGLTFDGVQQRLTELKNAREIVKCCVRGQVRQRFFRGLPIGRL